MQKVKSNTEKTNDFRTVQYLIWQSNFSLHTMKLKLGSGHSYECKKGAQIKNKGQKYQCHSRKRKKSSKIRILNYMEGVSMNSIMKT